MKITVLGKPQQRTRRHLMQAAVDLIIQYGYEAVTVTAITNTADYGRRTFYLYFRNKDDMAYQMMLEWFIRTLDFAIDSAQHLPTPQREYAILLAFLKRYREYLVFFRQMKPALDGDIGSQLRDQLITALQERHTANKFTLPKHFLSTKTNILLVGAMAELIREWASNPELGSAEQLASDLFSFLYGDNIP